MKILESRPITMAEAKDILVRREKKGEMGYEQKLSVEHLKKFTKIKPEKAEQLLKELSEVLRMTPETVVQIANIMPINADEIRLVFAREKFSLKEDEIKKILEILKKYA